MVPGLSSVRDSTSLQFLLFPGLGFSEARYLLATGAGGFCLSELFQILFNECAVCGGVVAFCHLLCGRRLAEVPGGRPGATIPAGGRCYEKASKMKVPR